MNRRHFLTGITGLLCAPAIVRAQSLMAVRPMLAPKFPLLAEAAIDFSASAMREAMVRNYLLRLTNIAINHAQIERLRHP